MVYVVYNVSWSIQVNANGFHAIVNPSHHAHLQQQQLQSGTPYAQVDPQKRQQADNDFRNTLIEEYGPEYLGKYHVFTFHE